MNDGAQMDDIIFDDGHPSVVSKPFVRKSDCFRVLVDADDAAVAIQPGQEQSAVPAAAQRAVHIDTIGPCEQQLHRLFTEHRDMIRLVFIIQGPGLRR